MWQPRPRWTRFQSKSKNLITYVTDTGAGAAAVVGGAGGGRRAKSAVSAYVVRGAHGGGAFATLPGFRASCSSGALRRAGALALARPFCFCES